MAIIIPKGDIFNYDFNILSNNSIKNVTTSYNDYVNWKPTVVTMDRGGTPVTDWPTLFYSTDSKLIFRYSPSSSNVNSKRQDKTFSDGNRTETKRSFDMFGYISYTNEFMGLDYIIENNIDSITDTVVYSIQDWATGNWTHSQTKTYDFVIYYRDNVPIAGNPLPDRSFDQDYYIILPKNQGSASSPQIDFYISVPNDYWKWEGYEQGSYEIVESHTITINLKPHYINRGTTSNNKKEVFSLPTTSFLNTYTFVDGYMFLSKITSNIIDNYNKGKMTLEIETRYTVFKDSDGNYVNDGKPYLIKVGDVVKPEMTNRFKDFQYEYVVTSAEYEYNGSDKLYLKLLQIN